MDRRGFVAGLLVVLAGLTGHALSTAPMVPEGVAGPGSQLFYQQHPDGGEYRGPFFLDGQAYYVLRQDGQRHVISQGHHVVWPREEAVLGIADLYTRTRLDPLFWSPLSGRMEFEGAETYDDRLFSQGIDQGNQQRLNEIRELVLQGRDLLPEQYLSNLSRVDRRTEAFLERPSQDNARQLLGAYDATAQAYDAAASSLTTTMVRSLPHDDDGLDSVRFVQPSGTSMTTGSFITYLERINRNADRLAAEVRDRYRLLEGGTAAGQDYRPMPSGGAVVDRERLISDTMVRQLAGAQRYSGLDRDDRISLAGSQVQGPYTVRLPCRDQQRKVVRMSQGKDGSLFQYFLVDGVARSAAYPGGGAMGAVTDPRIIPADVPVNVTIGDGGARYRLEGYPTIEEKVARNGTGIGRGATFYWMNRSPQQLGVLTFVEHQFAYWQCPLAASSRWNWHAIDVMHGRVADQRLGETRLQGAPSRLREAFRRVDTAEQAFLAEPSQQTMRRLGTAYRSAVSVLRGTSRDGAAPRLLRAGDELVDRAVFISSRVSVMDEVFTEHSTHDHTFQSFRDQLSFSGHIDNVARMDRAREVIGYREVMTYSFMDLFLAPRSGSVWRLEEWADPTVPGRNRPRTVIYPFSG